MTLDLAPCAQCGLRLPPHFLAPDPARGVEGALCPGCREACASCGDAEAVYDAVLHVWVCETCNPARRGLRLADACDGCGVHRHLVDVAGRTLCLRCAFAPGWNAGATREPCA